MGKIRNPQYRIVVADSRTKRDGRAIENLGIYHPKEDPSRIEVNSDRVQYWLSVGAQPSDPVVAILRRTGDWQRFKGLPAPAQPLKTAKAKVDQKAVYEAEAKAAAGLAEKADKAAKAPAKKAAKKSARKAAPAAEATSAARAEPAATEAAATEAAATEAAATEAAAEPASPAEPAAEPAQPAAEAAPSEPAAEAAPSEPDSGGQG
jgi:small subunit ribosomal protein S16